MSASFDYPHMMRRAMHGLIRQVLADVARNGLPGEHHFYISFATLHPDVEMSDTLSDRFPEEMTIVIQHEYHGLEVGEDGFSITLSFANVGESLFVPFDAIRTFVDPSQSFGLQLEAQGVHAPASEANEAPADEPPQREERGEAEVVSLDKFRK